jgi:predicted RNA-binding Zn-ribbon protein involved in translation (DUF1610 family)
MAEIDAWYARAPAGLNDEDRLRWVQLNSEIPCPSCGEPLWVLRTSRAQNRGVYHLAMCQNPDCTFQVDD